MAVFLRVAFFCFRFFLKVSELFEKMRVSKQKITGKEKTLKVVTFCLFT